MAGILAFKYFMPVIQNVFFVACNCDLHYSTGNCEEETGRCECRPEFNPPNCDSCAYGYFDYPNCKPCTCNLNGTEGDNCTPTDGLVSIFLLI